MAGAAPIEQWFHLSLFFNDDGDWSVGKHCFFYQGKYK